MNTILSYSTIILYGSAQFVQLFPWARPMIVLVYLALSGLLVYYSISTMRQTPFAERGTVVSLAIMIGGFGTLGYVIGFSSSYLLPSIVILLLQLEVVLVHAGTHLRQHHIMKFFGLVMLIVISSYLLVFPDGLIHFSVYPDRVAAALAAMFSAAVYAGYTLYTQRIPAPLSTAAAVTTRVFMLCLTVIITALYTPWKVYEQTTIVLSSAQISIAAIVIIGSAVLLAMLLRRPKLEQSEKNHQTAWGITGLVFPVLFLLSTAGWQALSVTQWVGMLGILVMCYTSK